MVRTVGEKVQLRALVLGITLLVASFTGLLIGGEGVEGYTGHEPIWIYGDDGFNATNGVTGGTGTPADPYIIEGWQIGAYNSIYIRDTNATFIIRDCYINSGGPGIAVYFVRVQNATVENVTIEGTDEGVLIIESQNIGVRDCSMSGNGIGISASGSGVSVGVSSGVTVVGNAITSFYNGISLIIVDNVDILNCSILSSANHGIYADLANNNVTIQNDTIENSAQAGVYVLSEAQDFDILECSIRNNSASGIHVSMTARDNTIINNNISENRAGIVFDGVADRNLVKNNTMLDNIAGGIQLNGGGSWNTVENNTIEQSYAGIVIHGDFGGPTADHNLVANNTVMPLEFGYCMYCEFVRWTTILNNEFTGFDGGVFHSGTDARIENNTFTLSEPGIGLDLGAGGSDNVIVNNTFVSCGLFSRFSYADRNRIESNTVNGKPLVFLEGATGDVVTDAGEVIIKDSVGVMVSGLNLSRSSVGVEIIDSIGCVVDSVVSTQNVYGVYISNNSDATTITNCNLSENIQGVAVSDSSGTLVDHNILNDNSEDGVMVRWSSNTTVTSNDMIRCGYQGVSVWTGSDGGLISGNFISQGANHGVLVFDSWNFIVRNNDIYDVDGRGVYLVAAYSCTIENNTIGVTDQAIYMDQDSNYNRIENNIVYSSTNGVYVSPVSSWPADTCDFNLIAHNSINGCSNMGIYLADIQNCTVAWNKVTNCSWGIYISGVYTAHNWIYLNNFSSNTVNACSDSTGLANYWNTSEPMTYEYGGSWYTNYLGNYYDNYTGLDGDGDGLGDTPYIFDGDQDNYPLMGGHGEYTPIPEFSPIVIAVVCLSVLFLVGLLSRSGRKD